MSMDTPKKKTGTCICYIGLHYHHEDQSGDGYCVDMFTVGGKLKQCKSILNEHQCPYGRRSPYDAKDAELVKLMPQVPR